jgi:hypothetical protein
MFKKLIGIIIIIFIINSAGVLLIGGGGEGIASTTEVDMSLNEAIKEAIGNVNNVPKAQSRPDELRTLFKRILGEKIKKMETLSMREKCSGGYYTDVMAMSIIISELKNIRKINLMNYLLAKRIAYVNSKAINHYLTLNFAMLERSVFEIGLIGNTIRDQLDRMEDAKTEDVKAKEMIREILDREGEILNHFFSYYEVFRTEE